MTHEASEIQKLRARNALRQTVEALLCGTGLDIRERASDLTIGNPRDPEQGRIHISYANGDVSWKRTTWCYLGPLQGYEPDDDPDRDAAVDASKIIGMLTGTRPGRPAP